MNKTKRLTGKLSMVLCSALLGYTTYGQPSVSVGVSVPLPSVEVTLPSVEIHAESDFYEPLTPHGEWVVVGSYGRCWRPARVETGWRPYCNGNWQRTDAGWYWVSDEPWAWATYHYGRWDFTDHHGWYWVPQTQWAPAWVSWHSGGGYVGWAPLLPSVRVSASGFVGFNATVISPRAFVFVEQRQFLDPIRPATVVVNNTTIINKTTTIASARIVNNAVINDGPAATVIEKASGRKVEAVPVRELRQKQEAAVVSKQRTPTATSEKKAQAPVPGEAQSTDKKTVAAPASPQVQKPAAATRETAAPAAKKRETQSEQRKPAPAAAESRPAKPDARPESKPAAKREARPEGDRPAADKQPTESKPARPSEEKVQRPDREKPAAREKGGGNPAGKDSGNKPRE